MERIELLQHTPIFRNLSQEDLALIAAELREETYPKGSFVFKEGDPGDTLYLIDSGQVAVVGDDDQSAIAFMGPGHFVGEISLLLAQPRTATLQVTLDARLWALHKSQFEQLIHSRPTIALEMMRELSRRLVDTTQRKSPLRKSRQLTAVFGGKSLELTQAIYGELLKTVGFMPLPEAEVTSSATLSGGIMLLNTLDLTEDHLAERLSYQIDVFPHIIVALSDQPDPLTRKAIELVDTVVSTGPPPDWFSTKGKKCDLWVINHTPTDLARTARRLVGRTVGLALSSGGSRGLAHIGVIKVLKEAGIPIDMVAGTSAGALFGALYAQGWSIERLAHFTEDLKAATRITNWDFKIPPTTAIVKGKIARDRLIDSWVEQRTFEDLETPLFMVAADVYTGEEVVFDSGPLADAIRASLSIPILAEPWHYQGRFLIDGGIVNPLPASVLRHRGADIVIASSVVQPLTQSYDGRTDKMPNILQTMSNMYSAMEAEVISKQFALIDVLIQHDVAAGHALDFDEAAQLIKIGEATARHMLPVIKEAVAAAGGKN